MPLRNVSWRSLVQVEVSFRDTAFTAADGRTVRPDRCRRLVERLTTERSPLLIVWVHRACRMGHSFCVISDSR